MHRLTILILLLLLVLIGIGLVVTMTRRAPEPQSSTTSTEGSTMELTSSAFTQNQPIPAKYTCDGDDISPPLQWSDVPAEAISLALIVHDPDAPRGDWVHWTVWNISPETTEIQEGSLPDAATEGMTDSGSASYGGPCPPSGTHNYWFSLYALDTVLDLDAGATRDDLEGTMDGHIIAETSLVGKYTRQR